MVLHNATTTVQIPLKSFIIVAYLSQPPRIHGRNVGARTPIQTGNAGGLANRNENANQARANPQRAAVPSPSLSRR